MNNTFLTRIGDAFHALAGSKSVPGSTISDWGKGDDLDFSGAKMVSPYNQSAWVYIAISRLAEKVSSIPFRISQMDGQTAKRVRAFRGSADPKHKQFIRRAVGEQILDSGDVVDLFNRPHPLMNRQLFWEMVVTWNALRGEFFVLPLDLEDKPVDISNRSARVLRLVTLPTDNFWHRVEGHNLMGWHYNSSSTTSPVPGQFLDRDEVIHSRTPNPYDFWRGMSPLGVAMVAAGSDYAAGQYAKGYWMNNADTGVIVTTDQILDVDQRKAIEVALRERKRKAGTADRPLFLFGGAKIDKPQLSGMETQFIENRNMNRQEIGAIYKVSDAIMGFSASTALSGGDAKKSEEQSFIENTIAPLCEHLAASVEPIIKTFGEGMVGWFDIDSLPVMQDARRARLDSGVKAFAIGATFNDINSVYDLGFPEYPWGKKSFLPFNLQEVGTEVELPGEEMPGNESETGTDPDEQKFLRVSKMFRQLGQPAPGAVVRAPDTAILWKSHIASRRKMVKVMQAKVSKVLLHYRGIVLAKLPEVHIGKSAEIQQRGLVDLVFSASSFGEALKNELKTPISATLNLAGTELHQELSKSEASGTDPWEYPPQAAKDYLARREQPIMGVGGTVRQRLNTTLQAGLDAGETMDQLSDRVRTVFNNLSDSEARRVAMTETNMAYNDARHLAMTEAGIEYKAWLSSHGPHVREAHAMAEDQYIDAPIPVDEPFEVGGEQLMFPGDDSLGATPGNIINCQCIQLAAQKTREDEKFLHYKIFGFPNQMKFAFPKK
jgi:HK97 family phage portal protein